MYISLYFCTLHVNSDIKISTGYFSKRKSQRDYHVPIQDVFVYNLNKLQEANEFSEEP